MRQSRDFPRHVGLRQHLVVWVGSSIGLPKRKFGGLWVSPVEWRLASAVAVVELLSEFGKKLNPVPRSNLLQNSAKSQQARVPSPRLQIRTSRTSAPGHARVGVWEKVRRF